MGRDVGSEAIQWTIREDGLSQSEIIDMSSVTGNET